MYNCFYYLNKLADNINYYACKYAVGTYIIIIIDIKRYNKV